MRESWPTVRVARCNICDRPSLFVTRRVPKQLLRGGLRCIRCGSRSRNRHLAATIVVALRDRGIQGLHDLRHHPEIRVLNTMHDSPIATQLAGVAHIDHTGYWDDIAPGTVRNGVRCEDLTALTYPDRSLDLIITEDVLEHIPNVELAFAEIHRVLRPGGVHVFTIPFRPDQPGRPLFDLIDGEPVLQEPIEYHTDPIRGRVAVYHHFGHTLFGALEHAGFRTRLVTSTYHDLRRHAITDAATFLCRRRR